MQNLHEEPFKYPLTPERIWRMLRFLQSYRAHPESLEPFLASVQAEGVPETNLDNVRHALIAWRKVTLDREALYPVNRYLLTGIGVVDVALLPVVLLIGVPDHPLFVALLSLVISLVLTSWSLFISFVKRSHGITVFGKVHGTLIFLALASVTTALAALVWHESSFIGLVFLILAAIAYLACFIYVLLVLIGVRVIKSLQGVASQPDMKAE